MKGTRAAQRYAKAILDLAKDKNISDLVNNDMETISKAIIGNDELQEVLSSPVINSEHKKTILLEIFKDVNDVTLGAFDVLLENNRIALLKWVAQKYTFLYNEMNQIQVATVTTAVPLDAQLETKILKKIKELTGNGANIINNIDPKIIGGFILRIGDLQYNASVAKNLRNLGRKFNNNSFNAKI
jgi:F-type H+-transporting ATPase subunit delta